MTKEQFLINISHILEYYKWKQSELRNLNLWVSNVWPEREVLNTFLDAIGLEKNEETYYAAFMRLAMLKEEALSLYLDKKMSEEESQNILLKAYNYCALYHTAIQNDITNYIEENNLLSNFYLTIWKSFQDIGASFNTWFPLWQQKIIYDVNHRLEAQFGGDGEKVMQFLHQNNLFDTGYNGKKADRCYSVLVQKSPQPPLLKGEELQSVSYFEAFPEIIGEIVQKLSQTLEKLEYLDDEIYGQKSAYKAYFLALKNAFSEIHTSLLVECWWQVDVAWMQITWPLQPSHPLEYYEDNYRNAVAPEWDMRIVDESILQSHVSTNMFAMYETLFSEDEKEMYRESYDFSLASMKRVQLYISTPVLYYGSELAGLFSAQVVPNDKIVSDRYGKKIFAFPEFVLLWKRSQPRMKLSEQIFEKSFLDDYYTYLNGDENIFYKVYDIETIGHEYGHTLWLYKDSEETMNESGNFSNIEEWKATAWWLVAYFFAWDDTYLEEVLLDHIWRSVGLMKYREVEDVIPYYCEWIIHLTLLFESQVLAYKDEKIVFQNSKENIEKLKNLYIETYKKERKIYLEKQDTWIFLFDYVVREDGVFLPKETWVRNFVESYYKTYQQIGNEIA
jgi:hypothetical protein